MLRSRLKNKRVFGRRLRRSVACPGHVPRNATKTSAPSVQRYRQYSGWLGFEREPEMAGMAHAWGNVPGADPGPVPVHRQVRTLRGAGVFENIERPM